MTTRTHHVAVVGGGPVGLAAALLLHRHGIRTTVLERERVLSTHPKARGMRTRTMELFTQWGIADQLWKAALPPEANRFIYCDSLVGEEVARSPEPNGENDDVSSTGPCRVSQDTVHRVLLDTVTQLAGVEVRMGSEVTGLREEADGVVLSTPGGEVVADFVIAADGVMSTVRRELGVELDGEPVLGYGQSIYWHGDLRPWTQDRLCVQFLTGHRLGRPSNIATVDGHSRWVTMVMKPPSETKPAEPTRAEAVEIVNAAVGVDVDPEIIDITTWRISARVARRWRVGRTFLAGDAAHSFPPTGGFGMNTGVQDVHNLVWKLALVLRGLAGQSILDTYEDERLDIARSNAAWSVANGARFRDIGRAIAAADQAGLERLLEDQRGHIDATDQDLGFGYTCGALVGSDDRSGRSPLRVARLGHRFPETTVVVDGDGRSSTVGLGDHLTLVTSDPSSWTEALSTPRGRALHVVLAVADDQVLGGAPVVLIRPDGIVGWIASQDATGAELDDVLLELTRGVVT